MKTLKSLTPVLAVATFLGLSTSSFAADAAWNIDANGTWLAGGSWSPASAPGATTGSTNTDTATFSKTLTAIRAVTVDANRNIGNITFSSTSGNYSLASGSLKLTSGGTILKSAGTATDTISSAIEIQGDNGTATFTNNDGAVALIIGPVSGVSTAGNTTTLTLNGTGTSTNNAISNAITDGAGGGKLAIVKDGTGAWAFTGGSYTNTFSGGVTLNLGTLTLSKTSAAGTGTLTINGGTLGLGAAGTLTISDTVINSNFALVMASATNLGTGNVSLGSAAGTTRTITASGVPVLTIDGKIVDGTTAKGLIISQASNSVTILNGNSTGFSGGLSINQGSLTLGNANAAGTGTLTFNGSNNTSTNIIVADGLSIANNIAMSGGLSVAMTGTGNLTLTGTLTVSNGNKYINRTGNTDLTGFVYLSDSSATGNTLFLGASGTNSSGSISNVISNYNGVGGTAGGVTKQGTGTWTLTAANTYTGSTTVGASGGADGGTLRISGSGKISTGVLTVYSGNMDLNGISTTVASIAMGGAAAGTSANILIGSGTLNTNGLISYSATNNPNGATISGIGGGVLNLNATRNISVANSTAAAADLTISAILADGSATAGITQNGAGTLVLSGANTYTGVTSITGGGVISVSSIKDLAGGSSNLGAPVTVANGTITMGSSANSGQLTYTGTAANTNRRVDLAGTTGGAVLDQSGTGLLKFTSAFTATGAGIKTLTLQGSTAGTGEIAGAIVNNSGTNLTSVTKSGTGTWNLSGTNTYTGATTVTSGTLLINGSTAAGSAFTVQTGGTLGGSGTILGTVSVQTGGTLAPGNSPGLLNTGALTLASGSTSAFQIDGTARGSLYDAVNVTGAIVYGGTLELTFGYTPVLADTFNLFDFTSHSGTFSAITFSNPLITGNLDYTTGILSLSTVPEPATWGLLAFSLTTVMVLRRRKR